MEEKNSYGRRLGLGSQQRSSSEPGELQKLRYLFAAVPMSVVTRCNIQRTLLRVQHVLMLTLCSLLVIPRALEVGLVVASPTTCRATPQMGGGTKEEAAVGGLGNPHEEEDLEDEGEAVDLEKVRVDTIISRHKCLFSYGCVPT